MAASSQLVGEYKKISDTLNKKIIPLVDTLTSAKRPGILHPADAGEVNKTVGPLTEEDPGKLDIYKYAFPLYMNNVVDFSKMLFNHNLIDTNVYDQYYKIPENLYNERNNVELYLPYHDYLFRSVINKFSDIVEYTYNNKTYKIKIVFDFKLIEQFKTYDKKFLYNTINYIPKRIENNLVYGFQHIKVHEALIDKLIADAIEKELFDKAKTYIFYINPLNLFNKMIEDDEFFGVVSSLYIYSITIDTIIDNI